MGNCKYMMFEGTIFEKNKEQFSKDVIAEVCHSSQIAVDFNDFRVESAQGIYDVLGAVYTSSMRGSHFIHHAIKYIESGRIIFHDSEWNCMNNKEEVDLYIISEGQVQKFELSGKGVEINIKGVSGT